MVKDGRFRKIRIVCLLVSILALCFGAFAFFTRYVSKDLKAVAGTFDVELDTKEIKLGNAEGIMNPGDAYNTPFTVINNGSKSADIKCVVTLTATKSSVQGVELDTGGNGYSVPYALYNKSNLISYNEDAGYKLADESAYAAPLEIDQNTETAVYTFPVVSLDGSIEKVQGNSNGSKYLYDLVTIFKAESGNSYKGSKLNYKIEIFAKQHENTTDADWSSIETFEKIDNYSITYELDGGTLEGAKGSYTSLESYVLPIPTKAGYQFDGWVDSLGEQWNVVKEIPKGTSGDLVFYAKWSPLEPILMDGPDFNKAIKGLYGGNSIFAQNVVFENFSNTPVPQSYLDVSKDQNGSVIAYDDNTKLVVKSMIPDKPIKTTEYCNGMFKDLHKAENIDISNLDMSACKDASDMFNSVGTNISNSKTGSILLSTKTTRPELCSNMFKSCFPYVSHVEILNTDYLDCTLVKDATGMFSYSFQGATTVNIDLSKCIFLNLCVGDSMFEFSGAYPTIDNVKNTFWAEDYTKYILISGKLASTKGMFRGTSIVNIPYFRGAPMLNKSENTLGMFGNCHYLESFYISSGINLSNALPTPDSSYIQGATGSWYDPESVPHTSNDFDGTLSGIFYAYPRS